MLKYVKLLGKQDDITLILDYETGPNAKAAFTNGRLLYLNTANRSTNCLTDHISKIGGIERTGKGAVPAFKYVPHPICVKVPAGNRDKGQEYPGGDGDGSV